MSFLIEERETLLGDVSMDAMLLAVFLWRQRIRLANSA